MINIDGESGESYVRKQLIRILIQVNNWCDSCELWLGWIISNEESWSDSSAWHWQSDIAFTSSLYHLRTHLEAVVREHAASGKTFITILHVFMMHVSALTFHFKLLFHEGPGSVVCTLVWITGNSQGRLWCLYIPLENKMSPEVK